MINRVSGSNTFKTANQLDRWSPEDAEKCKKRLGEVYHSLIAFLQKCGDKIIDDIKEAPALIKEDLKNFMKDYDAQPQWAKNLFKQYLNSKGFDAEKLIKLMRDISGMIK